MKDPQERSEGVAPVPGDAPEQKLDVKNDDAGSPADSSRRSFMGKIGIGGAAAVALAAVPLEPLVEGKKGEADASVVPYQPGTRANNSFNYRVQTAQNEYIDNGELPDNGDAERFSDFSGSWSKCLPHPYLGIVAPSAWRSLTHALQTGRFQDFENIQVGNPGGPGFTGTLNGPEGALAFDLEGLDAFATLIPPAPSITSAQTADEMVEHYWAALCRDVQFTDYSTSSVVAQACADLNNLSYVRSHGSQYPYPVTPANLFRGMINSSDGALLGPYISQFMLQPTMMGVQPMSQMYQRFLSVGEGGSDFVTNPTEYLAIESGFPASASLSFDPTYRYTRMGRDLTAYTHVDALHQAYLIAVLVLGGIGCPVNPGNPYVGSPTQHGFGTFGSAQAGPVDAVGTVPEMATRALKAAWFHKWVVNLRQRPEEMGALIQALLTNQRPMPQASQVLNHDVLNSAVLPLIHSQYGSYLLPLAFPEGAPTHPCYPTGHGTVGGACITAIKFFFDGTQRIRPLLQSLNPPRDIYVPSQDGLSLEVYTGADRDELTVNGELQKLAWNITIGHGIHSGIHFRSSSYWSMLLGEQVGLAALNDRANSYAEPFTIQLTKLDGTTATISNQGGQHR